MGEYGLDMWDVRNGPRAIEFGADDDIVIVREFVGHALARIEELTPEYYRWRAESVLETRATSIHMPSTAILMAPGWRIVNDDADPLEAIAGCFEYLDRRWPEGSEATREIIPFLDELAASWQRGRDDALEYLIERRDRHLSEQGYDNPH